ncbi:hypothetical protein [Streptomyces peucetius]|uniref:Glycosyltransferase RgtA/B/C/D-like domain-containing protein n=1 Tax=Streptomyces peucetius TaxID=1950 RepID=A0ABY6I4Q4_STRPE|nr:hypothetical protein [Streptomyces peucetius]UYQ61245.1 hypothetical protein OGH68_07015 [Streptomyces peucetius]
MTHTPAVTAVSRDHPSGSPGDRRPALRDFRWPAAVAVAYTLAQLALFHPGTALGWDETVYVSQVARGSEAAFFSAPRARGVTFLVAPVTVLTSSVDVIRVYLALLSGAGLFLALWVWRSLLPPRVLALAGGLFAGLWITLFYGPQVMPNLWVALGSLFTVGCFLRAAHDRSELGALMGTGVGAAFVALMRPSDAFWLVAPLAVISLAVRAWRRPALLMVLAAGAAVGCVPWIVEAYVSYGGLPERLRRASEIQGDLGWQLAFGDQMRALAGWSLCRPCDVPWKEPVTAVWWFVLPLFVVGGVVAAVRGRQASTVVVPTLAGLSLAVPYLLLIGYAAPRFLLPTYALLALPTAVCLMWIVTAARPRPLVAIVLALLIAGHLAVQYGVLHSKMVGSRADRQAFDRIAAELRRQGVRPPCVISGTEAPRIAFQAGCASRQVGGHDGSVTAAGLAALARDRPVAVVVEGDTAPPAYAQGWRQARLPGLRSRPDLRVHLGPLAR